MLPGALAGNLRLWTFLGGYSSDTRRRLVSGQSEWANLKSVQLKRLPDGEASFTTSFSTRAVNVLRSSILSQHFWERVS